ncbi:MAG: LppP/LprE family lipoprotein [Acidobacteria bacterium]|nr:MAG: LppP/LprE family lipoprotein [Acidobacteriota bacterium]
MERARASAVTFALLLGGVLLAQTPEPTWLDRPLSNWNVPARALPAAKPADESIAELSARCSYTPLLRTTAGERALVEAGWVPFRMFDRQIVQRDVEIIGGLAGADGMCRPMDFNVFVFVKERFAGTLSPQVMESRSDGSIGGAIRLAEDDRMSAGFARYTDKDALCCPSSHVTVRYRLDRQAMPPVVVPVSIRVTRP